MSTTTFYFDFSKKGQDLLGNQDVPIMINDQAIKESIINLLSTEIGSRPMNPTYGVNLDKYLFEPIDEITSDLLSFEISNALDAFESRINNVKVNVTPTEDELSYTIDISFGITYTNGTEVLSIDFKKIR